MDDLEWLARNWDKWPSSYNKFDDYIVYCNDDKTEVTNINYQQWLAKRAELQNKPSWDDSPEWAQWLAQWPDGEWLFYPNKPTFNEYGYCLDQPIDLVLRTHSFGEVLGEFRDTLEQRPEVQNMKEWKGPEDGLPPVGTICQADIFGLWTDCEIIAHFDQPAERVAAFTYDTVHNVKGLDYYTKICFRSKRSEEEKAVEDMVSILCDININRGEYHIARELYKAGYRKEPAE